MIIKKKLKRNSLINKNGNLIRLNNKKKKNNIILYFLTVDLGYV